MNHIWIWIQIYGLPSAFIIVSIVTIIGEIIRRVLDVEPRGLRDGHVRVWVKLCLQGPVRLEKIFMVSPNENPNFSI